MVALCLCGYLYDAGRRGAHVRNGREEEIVYSLRFTVYGLRFTVYSLRFTVYSLRFTDDYLGGVCIFCGGGGADVGHRGLVCMEREVCSSLFDDGRGPAGVLRLYPVDVDFVGTASIEDDGGDTTVVFVFPAVGGTDGLFTLEVQVDPDVLDNLVAGVHLCEPL